MGPVIGFVGALFFGVGAGASLAYTIAVGLARLVLLSALAKSLTPKVDLSQAAADKMVTVKSTIQPQAFVYGLDMLSGPLLFAQVENNRTLHRLVALTGREIESVEGFRFDDETIEIPGDIADANDTVTGGLYADVVEIATELGTSTQTAIAALTTAFATTWTSAHRGRGWALLYTGMVEEGNNEAFEGGMPQNLRAKIKGHMIYDPRLDSTQVIDSSTSPVTNGSGAHRTATPSTWAWSENPALCLADWLRWDQVGMGEVDDRVDWELCAAAADICEQPVVVPPASSPDVTQGRYTCNFTFFADQPREQVKQILELSMLGRSIFSQGKWRMWAGAALTSTVTLSENNLGANASVAIAATTGSKARYNRVRGKFVDPARNYSANAYPEQRDSAYETADNGIAYKTVDFNACNNSYECQRNAIIILRQSRNQNVIRFEGNWSCFRIQPGTVIELNFAELGWSPTSSPVTTKKFFVSEWLLRRDGSGVTLTLVEENDSVWTDPAIGDYTTRTPTSELVPTTSTGIKLSDANIHNSRISGICYAGVKLEAGGQVKYSDATGVYTTAGVPDNEWRASASGEYWALCTVNSSPGGLDVGTVDTWESLGADREYSINQATNGTDSVNITIQIAQDGAGGTIVATGIFDLEAVLAIPAVAISPGTFEYPGFGGATGLVLRFNAGVGDSGNLAVAGDETLSAGAPTFVDIETGVQWHEDGPASGGVDQDYAVRTNGVTGDSTVSGPAGWVDGTWLRLNLQKDWTQPRPGSGTNNTELIFELAEWADTSTVIASAAITLIAQELA